MSTRLTKPVTRVVEIDGKPVNVTITANGVQYREWKRHTSFLLPHSVAFLRAVTLHVEANRKGRKRKVRRSVI